MKKLYNVSLNAVLPGAADVAVVLPSAMTEFAQKLVLKEEKDSVAGDNNTTRV